MCGIVGVINPTNLLHEKFFEQALIVDQLRGFHSTGAYAVDGTGAVMWHKAATIGTIFVQQEQFKSMMATRGLRALVGHNRWATQGEVNKRNAHPFHHGDITLVHNGTLKADAPAVKKDQFGTDSEGIAYSLSQHEGHDAVLENLNGAFALVWHDLHDNCIRMIRNDDRPLWLVKCEYSDTVLFASEPKMLEWLAERNKIKLTSAPYQIQEGMLYRFDLNQAKGEDRIKPHIRKVNLRQKYNYSTTYYGYGGRRTRWEDEEDFPSRAAPAQGNGKKRPANIQPPAVIELPPRIRETTMSDAERQEFLSAYGIAIGEEIVCSMVGATLDANNTFHLEAVYDMGKIPDGMPEPDVVVYNVRAPLSYKAALDTSSYLCGNIVNVRKIDGTPAIVLNPSTVWVVDDKWAEVYTADGASVNEKAPDKKEEVTEPKIMGPGGKYIERKEWDSLVSRGCSSCSKGIHSHEAELVEWIGNNPLCHHCADDDEAIARLAVKH